MKTVSMTTLQYDRIINYDNRRLIHTAIDCIDMNYDYYIRVINNYYDEEYLFEVLK